MAIKLEACKEILHTTFSFLCTTPEQALEALTLIYNDLNMLTNSEFEEELAAYTKHLIEEYESDYFDYLEEE